MNIARLIFWMTDYKRKQSHRSARVKPWLVSVGAAFCLWSVSVFLIQQPIDLYLTLLNAAALLLAAGLGLIIFFRMKNAAEKQRAQDVSAQKQYERIIHHLVKTTAAVTGQDFFQILVRHLAQSLEVRYAFVAALDDPKAIQVRTIAAWADGTYLDNFTYELPGTPCANVIDNETCCYPSAVGSQFPEDQLLVEMQAEGYAGAPLFDHQQNPLGLIVVMHDQPLQQEEMVKSVISLFAARAGAELERQQNEQNLKQALQALVASKNQLNNAIESIAEGFALWDSEKRLIICNSRYRNFFYTVADELKPGAEYKELLKRAVSRGQFRIEGNPERWVSGRFANHHNPGGAYEQQLGDGRWLLATKRRTREGGVVGIQTDVTSIKQAERQNYLNAYFDSLTKLPNRANFLDSLNRSIAQTKRSGKSGAVFFIDLDRFKNINDTLGHAVGDLLLQQAATRLQECVRNTDIVARLGGDEFTIILTELGEALHASIIAENIIARFAQPFQLNNHEVYTSASIGIALFPNDSENADLLMQNADIAMYQAKKQGRNTFQFFTSKMTEQARHFVELEKELHRALDNDEFVVYYQPLFNIRQQTITGVEALLRWRHPEKGILTPGKFIHVAEETGLINDISLKIMKTACYEARAWAVSEDTQAIDLSINVSGRQFKDSLTSENIRLILNLTDFPARRLVFEMTESYLVEENEQIEQVLKEFRTMGIGLAIDDFGTGYSALSYLQRFPLTMLKIDRSFVRDINGNEKNIRLVETIIAVARGLGLQAIAEGVEQPEQLKSLQELGCDYAQGYWLGRPMPAVQFNQFLQNKQRKSLLAV